MHKNTSVDQRMGKYKIYVITCGACFSSVVSVGYHCITSEPCCPNALSQYNQRSKRQGPVDQK